jgi:hypothetical protein
MSTGARRTASTALAVTGAVLALVGGVALYAREEIFDPDAFSGHAVQTLDEQEVREALAEPIVDQAIDSGPDELINAQPLLRSAVEGAVASEPFKQVVRKGTRKVHKAIFDKEGEQIALTLGNADVVVTDAVESISPEVAKQLPRDLGDKVLTITESDVALTAARVAEDVRVLGLILPILAVLCLVASVVISPDRRRALMVTSACVAVAAAVGLVALLIARSLVLSSFTDETVNLAVAAVWEALLGGLRTWFLLGGAIAVIVAAASATAREIDAGAPARRLLALAARNPESPGGRLGRAAVIAALGLLLILKPDLALHIVTVIVGGYGLFYASCEALALIAPAPADRRRRQLKRPPVPLAIGSATLVAVVVAVALVLSFGDDDEGEVTRPAGPVTNCNGHAELCDRTIEDVAFPAAHNAMSAGQIGFYTPNHRYDIRRQLDDGIRAFLIDSHPGIKRSSGPVLTDLEKEDRGKVVESVREQLGRKGAASFLALQKQFAKRGGEGEERPFFCHIVCELGSIDFVKTLGWFKQFLDTHPDEFLILFIEDEVSPKDTEVAFEKSGILRYAYVHERDQPFPTLRELIESDRRLFVMAEKDNGGGTVPWYHAGFDLAQETPYTFDSPAQLADPKYGCRPNRGEPSSPLFQLNHWVEKLPRSPKTAAQVNDFGFLLNRARECQRRRGLLPNLLAVDYYDQGDVVEVSRVLNGLPRDADPSYRETD